MLKHLSTEQQTLLPVREKSSFIQTHDRADTDQWNSNFKNFIDFHYKGNVLINSDSRNTELTP